MVAVLGFAIFASLALVVDGGRQLGALSEARDIADNAARFGSQEVDLDHWRLTGRPVVDQARAEARAAQYLNNFVLPGTIDSWRVVPGTGIDADITVTIEVTMSPRRFFFIPKPVVVTQSATALDGVRGP